jgi:hypothetical protein
MGAAVNSRCPRCGRPLAGRDPGSLKHAANVRKLVGWFVAFPFTAGVVLTLAVAVGLGAIR